MQRRLEKLKESIGLEKEDIVISYKKERFTNLVENQDSKMPINGKKIKKYAKKKWEEFKAERKEKKELMKEARAERKKTYKKEYLKQSKLAGTREAKAKFERKKKGFGDYFAGIGEGMGQYKAPSREILGFGGFGQAPARPARRRKKKRKKAKVTRVVTIKTTSKARKRRRKAPRSPFDFGF